MTSHAPLVRRLLSAADNAEVTAAEVEDALDRWTGGLAPRSRLEVAAARVYLGPYDSSVPPLEALPLRATPVARVRGYLDDRRRARDLAVARGRRPAARPVTALRPKLLLLPKLSHRSTGLSPAASQASVFRAA